jgi:hypothetical protein
MEWWPKKMHVFVIRFLSTLPLVRARDHYIYSIESSKYKRLVMLKCPYGLAAALGICYAQYLRYSNPQNSIERLVLDSPTRHRRPNVTLESLPVGSQIFRCFFVQRVGGIGFEEEKL